MYVHRITENSKPAQLSLPSSAPQRRAVWCRAVSCPAVRYGAVPYCGALCRALLCVVFHTYQTTTLLIASWQSWREPACPRAFYTALLLNRFFSCFVFVDLFLYCTGIQQQPNPTNVLPLSIYGSTASTAQHSAITPAQGSKPSTCRSEYISKEVLRTCMALYVWLTVMGYEKVLRKLGELGLRSRRWAML